MTTTELAQEFAVTVRGYDRAQVDSYVDTLREWLGNATLRMEAAEAQNSQLREQVVLLRTRLAQLEQQVSDHPPRTIEALGDRLSQILLLAEEGAIAVQADAEAEAVAIIGRARQEAADMVGAAQSRHAEMEAFVAGAGQQAADVIQRAEAKGVEAARQLLADAETRAAAREAQAAEKAETIVSDARGERDRTLDLLHEERAALLSELRRLTTERDEVRGGLTKLKESLHRTISELQGGASEPPVVPPPDQPAK
ncbi:MAG: hypothetical protein QOK39_960 [Acidimicrobiaceae bacterium]|jgi:DivIVA domain-containing protein|nr:hypothetical protein [Acidimicrobiaceae bacterium]